MKKSNIKFSLRRKRRSGSIRKKISGTSEYPRLAIYRSLVHIYAQLIDDVDGKSILTVSSRTKTIESDVKGAKGKIEPAKLVGKELARQANEHNITKIVFDRKGYLYHGRVKALADGAREGGLQF